MAGTALAAWKKAVKKYQALFGLQQWQIWLTEGPTASGVSAEVHCDDGQRQAWAQLSTTRARGAMPEHAHMTNDYAVMYPMDLDYLAAHEVIHILASDTGFASLLGEASSFAGAQSDRLPAELEDAFERFISAIAKGVVNGKS